MTPTRKETARGQGGPAQQSNLSRNDITFDRARLPSLVAYVERHGKVTGRGPQRRADCLLTEHSHRQTVSIDVERGLWHCHACDAGGDVLDLHRRRFDLGFLEAARELGALVEGEDAPAARQKPASALIDRPAGSAPDDERKRAQAAHIWLHETVPLAGTPAELYLRGRGCALPPADGDLRFHPNLRLYGFSGPAMVARISQEPRDFGIGIHVTWLRRDGERWMRAERRPLGRQGGGLIRLWPDEGVTIGLAIAEGVETALAVARVFTPVWSCINAGNLASFPVLPGIEALTIFADRDESGTGQRAAVACAERWRGAGRQVRVLAAVRTGADMADIAAEVAA